MILLIMILMLCVPVWLHYNIITDIMVSGWSQRVWPVWHHVQCSGVTFSEFEYYHRASLSALSLLWLLCSSSVSGVTGVIIMGDILSTSIDNINQIVSSPDWSPPTAIYSNFNLSTWTLPSFPAVPSQNQVWIMWDDATRNHWYVSDCSSSFLVVEHRVLVL